MRNLLDTHALIWFLNGDIELSKPAIKAIESDKAINNISIASLWEIAIKISRGKLILNTSFQDIQKQLEQNNFKILPISFEDTLIITALPFHHNDPFDRIMIAQSMTNNLAIITKDQFFKNYNVQTIW